ncbi:uncharacterized protein LOC132203310 [Neocloeon triangulifer]|uniref:uncharacterized protein LOC132203310 n=1 Tax=Neocloeon triangulifer TaxID=2078957 RepID=UPI00286F8BC2|nr:uncharacterized protein LOC132203310 [Neocloeon triangulifer]
MPPKKQISRKRKSAAEGIEGNDADPPSARPAAPADLWPSRMGERLKDELTLYTEGYFYDCTFEVGCKMATKVFKCHKLTLARASPVLAQMLYGNDSNDKDDPIQIKSVQPVIFDLVMRYVYGGETDFKDVETACKIYKISQEWLIKDLTKATSNFLLNPSPKDVITVHEMFKSMSDNSHSKDLLEIIASNTSSVLKSDAWLKSSASTVLEIFRMNHLKVESEKELFEALYLWGSAGGNKETNIKVEEIRSETKDALKFIRFMTMDAVEFGELCKSECAKMMTDEDKLKVLLSIVQADVSLLPENVSTIRCHRKLHNTKHLNHNFIFSRSSSEEVHLNCESNKSVLTFATGCSRYYLQGIQLQCLSQRSEVDLICKVTFAHSPNALATLSFKGIPPTDNHTFLRFPHEVHLQKNVFYTISVQYFHKNPVKSISYSKFSNEWVWDKNGMYSDLKLFVTEKNTKLTDITALRLIQCTK